MNDRLKKINQLTRDLHGDIPSSDAYAFQSLQDHVDEVRDLKRAGDEHWKAETMDIIIHGYLMLDRHQVDPAGLDTLMNRRLDRFQEKITKAISSRKVS